jgi:hypothetical protein
MKEAVTGEEKPKQKENRALNEKNTRLPPPSLSLLPTFCPPSWPAPPAPTAP